MTLGQWLDRWLTEYKAGTVRPSTLKSYRCYIEYYIKPQLGDKQISLISQQDIQRMYRRLKTEGRIHEHPEMGHQLSDSMVRHIHSTTHVTSDMQKTASGIVGGFMEDIFGKELKPWQESEKPETEP